MAKNRPTRRAFQGSPKQSDHVGSVVRQRNRLQFRGTANLTLLGVAIAEIVQATHEGRELFLDFQATERAYASCILPLVTICDDLRRSGYRIETILPDDADLRHLFFNADWAHLLAPDKNQSAGIQFNKHMPARRFKDFKQLQPIVNYFVKTVVGNIKISKDAIAGLDWSVNELADNVLNHADCLDGGIIQVSTVHQQARVYFTICDSGQGILAAMKSAFPELGTDARAIEEAVKAGVTGNPERGQGNGLAGVLRIANLSGGWVQIISGGARLSAGHEAGVKTYPHQSFRGTIVTAVLGSRQFSMLEAMGSLGSGPARSPQSVIEYCYTDESSDSLMIHIKDESVGTGSRGAGEHLRTKCLNLLAAEPSKSLVIDWIGLPIIASSFADEAIGKLFVEMGPMAFCQRVRNVHMEQIVANVINKAIMQRVAQTVGGEVSKGGRGRPGFLRRLIKGNQ